MSKTTTLKTSVRDPRAIKQAAKELGVTLLTDVSPRLYFASQHPETSDMVLKLDGRYDVGLDKKTNGEYELVFDSHGGDISRVLGNNAEGANRTVGKFLQIYAKHAAINAATAKGYSVAGTSVAANGEIQLTLNVPN